MKEIPMLFSTPMVQALLAGRKTQTRRIADVPVGDHFGTDIMDLGLSEHPNLSEGKWMYTVQTDVDDSRTFTLKDKYGQPGDLLWVRETYKIEGSMSHGESVLGVKYKADGRWIQNDSKEVFEIFHKSKEGWRPNIFLPKVAARIWLQKTATRVERACDISEADAIAEGVEQNRDGSWHDYLEPNRLCQDSARASFKSLWFKINGPETWDNWVWVNSLNVLSTTGKPLLTEKIK